MEKAYEILESATRQHARVEVLEWARLGCPAGGGRPGARAAFAAEAMARPLAPVRQVRISLSGGPGFLLEAGSLQFLKGRIAIENEAKGVAGRVFAAVVGGESVFRPCYRGTGEIWLEPSLGHFLLVGLDRESIVVDQGTFVACEAGIAVSAEMQKNVSSALFGGEGLFQTKLSGTGLAVLSSAVPESEVVKYVLEAGEKVLVDGDFALMRSSAVGFSVGKSARGWVGTALSGEGLLQTFEGPGEVWLAPTAPMYRLAGRAGVAGAPESASRPGG